MKNLIKFTALAIAIMATANVAAAQASKTSTLNATASVGSDISVAGTDFNFGSIYRNNGAVTVDALGASAGYFVINGTGASTVVATLSAPGTLTSAATSGTLPVTWAYGTINAATGNCSAAFTSGGNVSLDGTAGNSGAAKVCVGGTVTPVANTTKIATDYTGQVSITVAFP